MHFYTILLNKPYIIKWPAQNGGHHQKGVKLVLCFFNEMAKGRDGMKVNGINKKIEKGQTLYDFLVAEKYDIRRIAVERNGEIVPKDSYQDVILQEEDRLEIVQFVGGG